MSAQRSSFERWNVATLEPFDKLRAGRLNVETIASRSLVLSADLRSEVEGVSWRQADDGAHTCHECLNIIFGALPYLHESGAQQNLVQFV